MSDHGMMVYGGIVTMVWGVEASSGHGVVAMGARGVPMLRLWEMGKLEISSPLEDV
jgi:hypothetical protein